jgi:EAL domain-containing protein (putative c-di-GMP-specific phosphodiesterase class I)
MQLHEDLERTQRTRELITALLAEPRQLGPDYQPIQSLSDGRLVGYKATGRGSPGTELADTLSLLDGARSLGYVERVDWAFRALAFEDMFDRGDLELHLTPEPETYLAPCPPRFAAVMGRANRELSIAAEVHSDSFAAAVPLEAGIAEIREWGWTIVLSDIADDDSALRRAGVLRPDIVQIDLRLAGRANGDEHHGVARLRSLAEDCGAELMALGVDSPSARDAAITLGASLARGVLIGSPGSLPGT